MSTSKPPNRALLPTLTRSRVAALNLIVVIGLAAVTSTMLWDMRLDATRRSDAASHTLLHVLSRDIDRNAELLDLSLQAVVDGLKIPAIWDADPALRRMILFNRSSAARNFGALLIINQHGTTVLSSRDTDPPKLNVADREYFQFHRNRADTSLHIGTPFVGRLGGKWLLPLSRRLSHPDGSFAGVVRAVIELDYFRDLLDATVTARGFGRIELYGPDGTVLASAPHASERIGMRVADNPSYVRMGLASQGNFRGQAIVGMGEHDFAYARVGELPLTLSLYTRPDAAFAEWWWRALTLGGIAAVLLAAVLGLSWRLLRELVRHEATEARLAAANADLVAMATTDALTGLGNRRRFDETLSSEWRRAVRSDRPLSLLVLDADWFKRFNDTYGHPRGDEALQLIARSLDAVLRTGCDSGYRIGGEEFAVILTDTDLASAVVVAERIRAAVADRALPHEDSPYGVLSVSCGAAERVRSRAADPAGLIAAADIALYAAKELGRDRVWSADRAVSALRKLSSSDEPQPEPLSLRA